MTLVETIRGFVMEKGADIRVRRAQIGLLSLIHI